MIRSRFGVKTAMKALPAVAAIALAVAPISGCSAGQITQTTGQSPAVDGTEGDVGSLALRNVRIQATQDSDAVRPGSTVGLAFTVVNESLETADRLTDISTNIGPVTLSSEAEIPVNGVLLVGSPQARPASTPGASGDQPVNTALATIALEEPITNGLNYDVVFSFERAGRIGLRVPISAADLR